MNDLTGAVPPVLDDSILQAMLARRVDRPVPVDLRASIERALDETPQARSPLARLARRLGVVRDARPGLVAAMVLVMLLTALVAGVVAVGSRLVTEPRPLAVSAPLVLAGHVGGSWTYLETLESSDPTHAGLSRFTIVAEQPELSGDGTFDFGFRQDGDVATTWGSLAITNSDGSWTGPCRGGQWLAGESESDWSVALSCRLLGTETYADRVLYLQMLGGQDAAMRIDGVVFAGPVPAAWGDTASSGAVPWVDPWASPGAGPDGTATGPTGPAHARGTWSFFGNAGSAVGGHAAVGSLELDMDDPRLSGYATFDYGLRLAPETEPADPEGQPGTVSVGPTWGTMVVVGPEGAWTGGCEGANWEHDQDLVISVALSCWLAGDQAYAGRVAYVQMLGGSDVPMKVEAVVYSGPIPDPGGGT